MSGGALDEGLARVSLRVGERVYVCFRTRRVEVLRTGGLADHPVLGRLGPDLLVAGQRSEAERTSVVERVLGRVGAVLDDSPTAGELLLDQRVGSGIGNIFKAETLFLERVNPWFPAAALTPDVLRRLYHRSAELLAWNTTGGERITTFDPRRRNRRVGESALWVYSRRARPCLRCSTPIQRELQGRHARVTYWCPTCQPQPASTAGSRDGTDS